MINTTLKLFSYNELFNHFVNLDINKKLPSRILLAGQEGIGKTSFALHLVNYFFSQNEITKYDVKNTIINKDSVSYNLVNNLSHPNFFYISRNQEKKFIEIDQIRSMINFLNKSSFNSNKKIILIDRFTDSTIAYQHYGMGLNKSLIERINKILLKNIKPNIVFLNIISMQNLSKRLSVRRNKNRYDKFKTKFYQKVQNGYLKLSKNKPNYTIIDSNDNLDDNKKKVLNKILRLIK